MDRRLFLKYLATVPLVNTGLNFDSVLHSLDPIRKLNSIANEDKPTSSIIKIHDLKSFAIENSGELKFGLVDRTQLSHAVRSKFESKPKEPPRVIIGVRSELPDFFLNETSNDSTSWSFRIAGSNYLIVGHPVSSFFVRGFNP